MRGRDAKRAAHAGHQLARGLTSGFHIITRLRVATNDAEAVEYHDVVVWRQVAEFAAQYLTKGRLVFVEGRLHSRSWDGQDGARRRTTEIIGASLQVISPRPAEGEPVEG